MYMLVVRRLSAEEELAVMTSIQTFLESRVRGIHVLTPKREIAGALAFRLTETVLRGTTRVPVRLDRTDVADVMRHFPHTKHDERERAKVLLTVMLREAINSGRLVAAEVLSTLGGITRNLPEFTVMTLRQWERLQVTPRAALGTTRYRRALTSK
jgi:hypothetical protein